MARWPWNRNKTSSTGAQVPVEVEEYYQSTRKERTGAAWLLALGTLLLTVLIAAALFFGGRWVYRAIFDDDNDGDTSSQQIGDEDADRSADDDANSDDQLDGQPPALPGNDSPGGDNPDSQSNSGGNGSAAGNGGAGSTPNSGSGAQTPVTGPETPEIPRTGPTEE